MFIPFKLFTPWTKWTQWTQKVMQWLNTNTYLNHIREWIPVTVAPIAGKGIKPFRFTLIRKQANTYTPALAGAAGKLSAVTITPRNNIFRITIFHLIHPSPKHTSPPEVSGLHLNQRPFHSFLLRYLKPAWKHTKRTTLYSSLLTCSGLRLPANW